MINGNPSRRPFNDREPNYSAGVPDRPSGMTPAARKVWDALVAEMAPTGVLRTVDAGALVQLCEDQAMLDELRKGLHAMAKEFASQARKQKKPLPGNALTMMSRTAEGRRTLSSIRELSAQIIVQRREFGLTPASNSRVNSNSTNGGDQTDDIETALCG
jgi:phage terminase small subunit